MFYANEMVRLPDSPRHQNAECWLGGKSIRTANKTVQQTSISGLECPTIDIIKLNDSIKHGVLRIHQPRENRLKITYKHGTGIYTQYGNISGKIDIPLPDIYLVIDMDIISRQNGYQTRTNNIYIGSEYIAMLPLTNVFSDTCDPIGRVNESNGKNIHYTKMCHDNVLDSMVGTRENVLDIINNVIANISPFLLTHGNNDIDLQDYRCGSANKWTAEEITYKIFDNHIGYTTFTQYWYLLNYLMEFQPDPEKLYAQLNVENVVDVIKSFGKTERQISTDYQQAENEDGFPVNYDDDYDDYDDYDDDDDYDEDDDW